jgi:DNA-directed RNA polymerase specialized sigma24 family protein
MAEQDWLAVQFEQNRHHLQAVAYGMLGTVSEAQDAAQEAWLRLGHSDPGAIGDLRGWLTTVVGRISLDMLRAHKGRREVYPGSWLPEPVVEESAGHGPEEAVLADTIGMALLVVLVNGEPGALNDQFAVIGFTIVGGRIAALKLVADQARLRHLTIQP